MSILIKGMEMPKDCFECPWRCKVDPENLLCRISGEYFEETFSGTIQNRHKSCPLVPVPPHGRLIDESWLKEAIITTLEALKKNPKMDRQEAHLIAAFDTLRVMVEDAPTIIPAEEVYDRYTDTAGNIHWTGTKTGQHIIPAEECET